MKTNSLAICIPFPNQPRPEAVAALIDDIIQWKIEKGDLPEVLTKKDKPETPPKNESNPFILTELYDWMMQELDALVELPPGEMS
jgi:hypothetical protein